ncbi:MAG TPA: hypothetical protein VGC88_04995 [Terriglobales bacterium]
MAVQTQIVQVGERAPDFELGATNSSQMTSLAALLARGPVIIEFLRGTW